jgi:superfamily I DNA/RNA helicase
MEHVMWSEYQEKIFSWATDGPKGHLMVKAYAGTGKTTTIVELYKRLPKSAKVIFMAFNKKISEELKNRGVPASTLNSFGMSTIKRNSPRVQMKLYKLFDIAKVIGIPKHEVYQMGRLVDLGKAYLKPKDSKSNVFEELAEQFDIEIKVKDDYRSVFFQNTARLFQESFNLESWGMDFSDQISMPYYHGMRVEKYDYVIIDEAQDLAPNKLELASMGIGSHFICVGDPYQAIYGFCGADSLSMEKIEERFSPEVLGLPITYRCGKRIVEECKKHGVGPSDFQAGPNNSEGIVSSIDLESFRSSVKSGNYVLCRTTAPLVRECFNFIKKGIRAVVLGREIGKKLIDFIDKVSENVFEISSFCEKLEAYRVTEGHRLRSMNRDSQADELDDKVECINVFCEGATSTTEVKSRIERIFDDTANPGGITLSTIHKAKGLEAESVYILPHKSRVAKLDWQKQEEENLIYVAITRAKSELFWVKGGAK